MKKSIQLNSLDLQQALCPASFKKLKASQLIRKEQIDQIKGGGDIIIEDKILL